MCIVGFAVSVHQVGLSGDKIFYNLRILLPGQIVFRLSVAFLGTFKASLFSQRPTKSRQNLSRKGCSRKAITCNQSYFFLSNVVPRNQPSWTPVMPTDRSLICIPFSPISLEWTKSTFATTETPFNPLENRT